MSAPAFLPTGDLLARHARLRGAEAALVDAETGRCVSFAELHLAVAAAARRLRDAGLAPGGRALLVADTGIEAVVHWLAVWRLGGVVCPVDPRLGLPTLRAIAATVRAAALLVDDDVAPAASAATGLAPLSLGWPGTATAGGTLPDHAETDLAAILSTSGSAGAPKLVVHDHGSYRLAADATLGLLGLGPGDRLLEYRSLAWSSTQILSLVPALVCGMTLVLSRGFSRRRLPEWLAAHGVTALAGVPTVLAILLAGGAAFAPEARRRLRFATASSAPLPEALRQRFAAAHGVPVLPLYGMTEAGWIAGTRPGEAWPGAVGRRTPHLDLRILDQAGRPCPPGQQGEVVVEGPQTALAYMHGDGSLAPLRGRPLRTGDLGALGPDGVLRLTGRLTEFIIRGGVKIAPAEIEAAAAEAEGVAEAAACGVPDPVWGEAVACFVVPAPGAATRPDAVLAACRRRLPPAMLPREVHVVAALPRGPTGKVQRHRLRDLLPGA